MQKDNHTPLPAAAKGNPRAASVRIKSLAMSKACFQRRHDFRKGKQPDYVDGKRRHLNRELIDLRSLPAIRRENLALRKERGCLKAMKSNAAVVVGGIITFGHEAQVMFGYLSDEQQDDAYRELAERVAEILQTQLESLVVHGDEAAPHAHFMLRGYCDDGQPVSKRATYRVTRLMQDVAAEVMQKYCPDVERGHTKWDRIEKGADYAETINRSVKQLHEDLPKEIAVKQAELQILVDEIVALTASIDKTRRHFDAMEARRDKTAKQMKTARTYKKRLAKKEEALSDLVIQCGKLRVELDAKDQALHSRQTEAVSREVAHQAQVLADADRMALEALQIAIWNEELDAMSAAHVQKVCDDTAAAEARDAALRMKQAALDIERLAFEADVAAKAEAFERQHGEIQETAYLADLMRFYADEAATEAARKAEMANLARQADEAASEAAQSMAASAKKAEMRSRQQIAKYDERVENAEAQLDMLAAGHAMLIDETAQVAKEKDAAVAATAEAQAEAADALVTRDTRFAEIGAEEKAQQKIVNERDRVYARDCEALRAKQNEVAAESLELTDAAKGILSIGREIVAGTIRIAADGNVKMKNPSDIKAAPRWVWTLFKPFVLEITSLKARLTKALASTEKRVEELDAFLTRDDLTIETRATAEGLQQVDWMDDFDDPL